MFLIFFFRYLSCQSLNEQEFSTLILHYIIRVALDKTLNTYDLHHTIDPYNNFIMINYKTLCCL